jgi:disulfide bond formation protein DsbB
MRKLGQLALVALFLAAALSAGATPIRPDIRKLVAEPTHDTIQFAPARAGWNGPEGSTSNAQFTNPAVERLTPAAAARETRAAMLALAIPDWRVIIAIAGLIVLLRVASRRKKATEQPVFAPDTVAPEDLRPAA